ncbi:hypothetical protein OIU84_000896 [Salix udensis]|uniref:Uncharacterized protein n=1 Tax=Salix udensis TaxID=889485 RepID=A0AAD6L6V5_9ROSI|nr:hypothetical protein OIU84_000896 [Salix udensis]
MKGLSIFSRKKVEDEQDKQDDVALQNKKDPNSLETMFEEMTSLKSRLLFKEKEVQILEDMVAQKDEEIRRFRNRCVADIESDWKEFDTFLSITGPGRSKNETRHKKEPREEEIKGMAQNQTL